MDWTEVVGVVVTVLTALGGLELFKWLYTRRSKRKESMANAEKAEAEAEKAEVEVESLELKNEEDEFHFLRDRLKYKDEELMAKDKRITELVERVIEKTMENGTLSARISALEAERKMKLCERRGCPERQPQSGY
jgi:hypothetical protein